MEKEGEKIRKWIEPEGGVEYKNRNVLTVVQETP